MGPSLKPKEQRMTCEKGRHQSADRAHAHHTPCSPPHGIGAPSAPCDIQTKGRRGRLSHHVVRTWTAEVRRSAVGLFWGLGDF